MEQKKLITGTSKLAADLVKVLGLPAHTTAFELRVATEEIVQIKCWYYPELGVDVVEAFAEYNLVPKAGLEEKPA